MPLPIVLVTIAAFCFFAGAFVNVNFARKLPRFVRYAMELLSAVVAPVLLIAGNFVVDGLRNRILLIALAFFCAGFAFMQDYFFSERTKPSQSRLKSSDSSDQSTN